MGTRIFGELNSHATGMIIKELVRRAIRAIRNERMIFEVTEKQKEGKERDICTSVDKAAQKIYLKGIEECFPEYGIIAEEDSFKKMCKLRGNNVYFSVAPLDGTKAFERRQSHGIGTQIALLCGEEIVSAYVGDVMTQEIYGFRPDSDNVWRISEYDTFEKLEINKEKPLIEQYLLMRDNPESFNCPLVRKMNSQYWPATLSNPLFRDINVEGGSIGISFARLWKGEVGGLVMNAHKGHPWDVWPTTGISMKMGFAFFTARPDSSHWKRYTPVYHRESVEGKNARLIIHESRVPELEEWQAKI